MGAPDHRMMRGSAAAIDRFDRQLRTESRSARQEMTQVGAVLRRRANGGPRDTRFLTGRPILGA